MQMFNQNGIRTGHITEYKAEDKYTIAVDAHDTAWFEHKERCVVERLKYLEDKGVMEDQKLLEKELKRLEKHVATAAYHNDGSLNGRQLEHNQYDMVINMLTYRTLCTLIK